MNKYLVFRSMDDTCDGGSTKKKKDTSVELVAVEYGYTYIEAIPDIVNAINADLSEFPESKHATVSCIEETSLDNRYISAFIGIIAPAATSTNILKAYHIEEHPDDEG